MSVDQHSHDAERFDVDKTTAIIRKVVEDILSIKEYDSENIDHWSREIVDSCQRSLEDIRQSFRTIVTTMIIPKTEEMIHMSNACLWDFLIDGSTIIQWENDSMYCIVSAFALSLSITAQSVIEV